MASCSSPGRRVAAVIGAVVLATMLTSCNRHGFSAHIESVEDGDGWSTVSGWVQDPFASKRSGCPQIVVAVDGIVERAVSVSCAGAPLFTRRTDVEAALGGTAAAFSIGAYGLTKGRHTACVDVSPWVPGVPAEVEDPLDCFDFTVRYDQRTSWNLEAVSASGGVVTASGWFHVAHQTSYDGRIFPGWTVDGALSTTLPGAQHSKVARPDVVAVKGPYDTSGYTLSVPLAAGAHRICLVAVDHNYIPPRPTETGSCVTTTVP